MSTAVLPALARELHPLGLNLIGTTTPAAYDARAPAAYRLGADPGRVSTLIVLGSGGGAFWAAFRRQIARDPALAAAAHPLDAFTTAVMEERALPAVGRLGLQATLHLPFTQGGRPLSFQHLAEAAGLGRPSVLGLLVHPEYGPWIALRGALAVDAAIAAPRPAAGFDPCARCRDRPCVAACPAGAVRVPTGWDVRACVDHRVAHAPVCADRCEARVACVYGRVHRHPPDELAYHQRRAFAVMAPAR